MKTIYFSLIIIASLFLNASCGGKDSSSDNASNGVKAVKKSPDQIIGDKLAGEYFLDDYTQLTIEYFKDGKYSKKYVESEYMPYAEGSGNEYSESDVPNIVEVNWEETGIWKIENGFLKLIVEKVKSDYHSKEELKEKVKELNNKNVAYKIKEITEQKLVITDPDDEELTYKRKVQ
jgi:hypothetical protein